MKAEIKEILNYLEKGEDEILRLRDRVKDLDAGQDPAALQSVIDELEALTAAREGANLGYYDLFLGCAYHERADYRRATAHLKQALRELGLKNNKAVAHWLLSVNYSGAKEFDKARRELVKAERLSTARIAAMQGKVDAKIRDMFDDPIFSEVPPLPKRRAVPPTPAVVAESTPQPTAKLAESKLA